METYDYTPVHNLLENSYDPGMVADILRNLLTDYLRLAVYVTLSDDYLSGVYLVEIPIRS